MLNAVRYVYYTEGGGKRFGDECRGLCYTLLRIDTTATMKYTRIL